MTLKNNEDKFKKWLMITTKNSAIDNTIGIQEEVLDRKIEERKIKQ